MRKLLAANWKMNLPFGSAERLTRQVCAGLTQLPGVPPVVLAVPFPYLLAAGNIAQAYPGVEVGAQNLSEHAQGAYTGEVSGEMIRSCGASFVLIGHSERRHYYLEDDSRLFHKLQRAFEAGLRPIFCVGETLQERQRGNWQEVLAQQLSRTVLQLPAQQVDQVVLAYEPVWAIGTGQSASPVEAAEAHNFLRQLMGPHAERVSVLYGGSVKPENASALFAHATIDGALVGGASLDAEAFLQIASALRG